MIVFLQNAKQNQAMKVMEIVFIQMNAIIKISHVSTKLCSYDEDDSGDSLLISNKTLVKCVD